MRLLCWIWYISVILLFLRSCSGIADEGINIEDESTTNSTIDEPIIIEKVPQNATSLGVPRCDTNHDCAHGGVCKKGSDGYGICLCSRACPATIPSRCNNRYRTSSSACLVMHEDYRSKFDLLDPTCYSNQCVCPPQFDDIDVFSNELPLRLNTTLLPVKCDKRDLQVVGKVYPSSSVYKGSDVKLFCCINIDPEGFVDAAGVFFVQNTTIMREATGHPFKQQFDHRRQSNDRNSCWDLEIKNAQPSDSGSYMCMVTTNLVNVKVNYTIDFEVKAPQMIQKLRVNATEKDAVVTWGSAEGSQVAIDLRNGRRHRRNINKNMSRNSTVPPVPKRQKSQELLRRSDTHGKVVFNLDNATSPVVINDLRAATPYTLFVSGKDGTIPFEITEHFATKPKRPHAPKEEDVRVLNSGSSLICEVEWKSPSETNGRITQYYVMVRGSMRKAKPDGSLSADDFPLASDADKRCANWDGDEAKTEQAKINPIDFTTDFFSCKFGPLRPNRNYSVNVWAVNDAGRSQPAVFKKTCLTNFAQPDVVEEPQSSLSNNQSTFGLKFGTTPDDTNGPISCYYVAIVPLPKNVSLDVLPPPNDIVMDSFSKVFTNNLHNSAAEKKRYFAYVAESYSEYPKETIIGDGMAKSGMEPCNVQYLSRYSAEDLALRTGLKYTGFLIVRVDKEDDRRLDKMNIGGGKFLQRILDNDRSKNPSRRTVSELSSRRQRQLHLSGPAYGYSGYFKPILLDPESSSSGIATALTIILPLLLFVGFATAIGMAVVHHKRGDIRSGWCPLTKMLSKDIGDRTLLKQTFGAVPVEDLPTEYVIRHRDSDFVFVQEYEALPHFQFETSASNRKENAHKNRYNDIRAFDETRVRLEKIDGDDTSDYINANFIKSWNSKKMFIAAQAPLDSTLDDFWRMIWEQNSYLIVMVANLTEKKRQQCAKYWPDDQVTRYGNIIVQPVDSSYYSDYAIRTFDIVHVDQCAAEANGGVEYANVPMIRTSSCFGINSRRITQYHFMNWNDYKAPECSTGMLRFLHILRELNEFNESPIVIHCSAGVGRTGTFITIDSMFDQCNAEGKANVFEYVSALRRQRNLMVQSVEQYVFIYKALAEWHMYGYTDLDVDQFEQHYQMLIEPDMRERAASFNGATKVVVNKSTDKGCENGLEAEFKKLERTLGGPLSTSFAAKDDNLLKNRFEAAVPYDKYRVVLSPTIGYADSTYINASHLGGYFYSYIVAQDPVSEQTAYDFWRMISEQQIATVVMLSNEDDWSTSERYWPDEEGKQALYQIGRQSAEINFVQEEKFPDFYQRTMTYSIKDSDDTKPKEIVQFAFTSWPSESLTPVSSAAILSLISRVLERQSKMQEAGPILVHCRNGSSETGIFVCISLLLLRLKAEHRIDVFQTVKGLQNQRPMMFTKMEQYAFCYKAVSDYISKSTR